MATKTNSPLVFVYRGLSIPKYAVKSLALAEKTTPNPITVLADSDRPGAVSPNILWVQIASFYDPAPFQRFASRTKMDIRFRDGFWLHTAERFFVLNQYANYSGTKSFFHGELDCLFFSLDTIEREIQTSGVTGMFFPKETSDRVIASLVYVNDVSALFRACQFIIQMVEIGNEMDILGALPVSEDGLFHALPTAEYLFRRERDPDSWQVSPPNPFFIVDGAVLGRWLFGVDPRNTNTGSTRNLVQNPKNTVPFSHPVISLQFQIGEDGTQIFVSREGVRWFRLLVIHVHSKVHSKLTARYIRRVIKKAARGKPHPIIRTPATYLVARATNEVTYLIKTLRSPQETIRLTRNMLRGSWWVATGSRLFARERR